MRPGAAWPGPPRPRPRTRRRGTTPTRRRSSSRVSPTGRVVLAQQRGQPFAVGVPDQGARRTRPRRAFRSRPGPHGRGQARARQARHVRPGHVRPGHVRPGHVRPGHVRPGHVRPGHVRPTGWLRWPCRRPRFRSAPGRLSRRSRTASRPRRSRPAAARSLSCGRWRAACLSSSSWVYSGDLAWRRALSSNPAPIDLTAPILRTTRPNATPRSCSIVMPGRVNPVVTEIAEVPIDCVMLGSTQGRRDGVSTWRAPAARRRRRLGLAAARRRAAARGSGRGLDGVHVRQDRGHRVEDCLIPGPAVLQAGRGRCPAWPAPVGGPAGRAAPPWGRHRGRRCWQMVFSISS